MFRTHSENSVNAFQTVSIPFTEFITPAVMYMVAVFSLTFSIYFFVFIQFLLITSEFIDLKKKKGKNVQMYGMANSSMYKNTYLMDATANKKRIFLCSHSKKNEIEAQKRNVK